MAEYSKLAKGSFTSTGATKVINLPFQPDYVEIINVSVANSAPTANGVFSAKWWSDFGQGKAVEEVYNSSSPPALTADTVTTNGISTFAAGLAFQFGPKQQIVSATAANPVVFTVTGHGYSTGDIVQFQGLYQTGTTGMPQIAGMPFVITVIDVNTFSIAWDGSGSNYTALSGSPVGAFVQKILYPYLYAPGVSFISAISLGNTTTITTTSPNNYVLGQEVAFRIPAVWGTAQLNPNSNVLIPGSTVYGIVSSITNSTTFVVNINSSAYTAFNVNQPVSSVPGLTFPQVVAAGDLNTGGVQYSGGNLYPSPIVNGNSTINGPAIQGAFVNNTSQGFVIGVGAGGNQTASVLVGSPGDLISWRAIYHDLSVL